MWVFSNQATCRLSTAARKVSSTSSGIASTGRRLLQADFCAFHETLTSRVTPISRFSGDLKLERPSQMFLAYFKRGFPVAKDSN